MYPEIEVICTLMGLPVYEYDSIPMTTKVSKNDVLWAIDFDRRSNRSKIILTLLSAGF